MNEILNKEFIKEIKEFEKNWRSYLGNSTLDEDIIIKANESLISKIRETENEIEISKNTIFDNKKCEFVRIDTAININLIGNIKFTEITNNITGECINTIICHRGGVNSLTVLKNGLLVAHHPNI